MSAVVEAMAQLLNIPEVLERMVSEYRAPDGGESRGVGNIPADILDTPKEYVFYLDVPGLSKSDIQVYCRSYWLCLAEFIVYFKLLIRYKLCFIMFLNKL